MKIVNSNVNMTGTSEKVNIQTHSLVMKTASLKLSEALRLGARLDTVELSDEGKRLSLEEMAKDKLNEYQEQMKQRKEDLEQRIADTAKADAPRIQTASPFQLEPGELFDYQLLEMLLGSINGKEFKFFDSQAMMRRFSQMRTNIANVTGSAVPLGESIVAVNQFTMKRASYQRETVSFGATGQVQTADGRTIDFDVSMFMQRESYEAFAMEWAEVSAARLCDPLVINLDGQGVALTTRKYDFDLTMDGNKESISFVSPGSAFLAFDKNGDGTINDGSELFGAKTGNGFEELKAYDVDGNGWIDESDAVWDQLLLWTKDENGKDRLTKLSDAGIGALYLGSVQTTWTYADSGVMQRSGVYLNENGKAGTMHHIDLVI